MSDLLGAADIEAGLSKLPGWTTDGKALTKTFDCRDFRGSIKFVNAVANIANAIDHHPDIRVSWNKVTIVTWSHDAGGVTARDLDLATRVEAVGG